MYSISILFNNFYFKKEVIRFILNEFQIIEIKYRNEQFELKKIPKKKIFDIKTNDLHIILKEEDSRILIQENADSLSRIYGGSIDFQKLKLLLNKIEGDFKEFIVFSMIYEDTDEGLQNTDEIKYWRVFEREIPSYVEILPNPLYKEGAPGMDMIEKEFINIESLPGHSHQMVVGDKLWFGSCWQMYFSPIYYKYIPKFLFDNFTDCYENKVFENGLRRITLFENPEDYDLPENRAKQWAFRRALGIDSIAHEVCPRLTRQQIELKDLPVVITKKDCVKGTTRVSLFEKDKIIIKEFLDDGVTLVWEEIISK